MSSLPPIRRSVTVSWDPPAAFRRFTADFGSWWPWRSHSIGGARVKRVVFEPRVGGLIFEEHQDGRRFQWGRVLALDPPHSVKFTWHPSRAPETAQEVELRFVPEAGGTRVELVSDKWENWGKNAARARRGYDLGWGYVLNFWAGRRTPGMLLMDGLARIAHLVELLRGGRAAAIERAEGEISRA